MTTYLKSILGIFVMILTISILSGGSAQAGENPCPELVLENGSVDPTGEIQDGNIVTFMCDRGFELVGTRQSDCEDGDYVPEPPTCEPSRQINVRVIAICAAPVGVEAHDGGDSEVCLCFGPRSNGFNATGIQRNGKCARSQIGPFCFVHTLVGPLFWKETVTNQTGSTTVIPGEIVPISVPCPPGKMVLSCEGRVTVGDTNEPAANTASNIFPTDDGLACRHVARTDLPPPPPPDPCAQPTADCPCDFDAIAIPMTPCCWPDISPSVNANWLTPTNFQCFLNGQESVLFVEGDTCGVSVNEQNCSGSDQSETGLNPSQVTACQCDLEEYATALNEVAGITVNINGVPGGPYDCTPP